ncbi:MAG: nucleotidyltransferase family protein [Firmicutes bacterium]|nr:nucleotidyltransferase family protein [Bacillota bacterium]
MNYKNTAAVIMAGGRGERLRPLTDKIPKPLVRIGDSYAISSSLRSLSSLGISRAVLTVRYRWEDIVIELCDLHDGVRLSYLIEKESVGTAGGVRAALPVLDSLDITGEVSEIIVLSGDAVFDMPLEDAFRLHRHTDADATLVLYRLSRPEDAVKFGVVTLDGDIITGFIEKPSEPPRDALVNTGIYILSRDAVLEIPERAPYDFGRELFPRMLNEGKRLAGYVSDGYWCDVGSPESYGRCCFDSAAGLITSTH